MCMVARIHRLLRCASTLFSSLLRLLIVLVSRRYCLFFYTVLCHGNHGPFRKLDDGGNSRTNCTRRSHLGRGVARHEEQEYCFCSRSAPAQVGLGAQRRLYGYGRGTLLFCSVLQCSTCICDSTAQTIARFVYRPHTHSFGASLLQPLDNYNNVVEACRALIDNKRWSKFCDSHDVYQGNNE
jgi:hypothetical protein